MLSVANTEGVRFTAAQTRRQLAQSRSLFLVASVLAVMSWGCGGEAVAESGAVGESTGGATADFSTGVLTLGGDRYEFRVLGCTNLENEFDASSDDYTLRGGGTREIAGAEASRSPGCGAACAPGWALGAEPYPGEEIRTFGLVGLYPRPAR